VKGVQISNRSEEKLFLQEIQVLKQKEIYF